MFQHLFRDVRYRLLHYYIRDKKFFFIESFLNKLILKFSFKFSSVDLVIFATKSSLDAK